MSYHKFSSKDYILFREPKTEFSPVLPDTSVPGDSPVFIDSTDSTDSHVSSSSPPRETSADNRTKVKKKNLVNKLNYLNFNDDTILIKFRHKKYDSEMTLQAKPMPCIGNILECRWIQVSGLHQKIRSYIFDYFLLSDGLKLIKVEASVQRMDDKGIILELPEHSSELSLRKTIRHRCTDINAQVIQNGAVFNGRLVNFSAMAFNVEIEAQPPQTFEWLRVDQSVQIVLRDISMVYYSGKAKIIRHNKEQQRRCYVLEPMERAINRFMKKEFRSIRHKLTPSPNAIFTHPFTNKIITLPILDIAGSGFSVEESADQCALIPGLIIADMEIEIANSYSLKCMAQVIHRKKTVEKADEVFLSGLAILDMNHQDQMNLSGILQRSENKNTYVCNRINIDNLWKFFFDAGFIYPQKYKELCANKDEFKILYEKLYIDHPQIARHFIYQNKGIIHGHMSMLRYFTNTWLVHHHTSDSFSFKGPGLTVLKQACQYINDFYQQKSSYLKYIVCYYRANNRFPNRIFGKFTETLNSPGVCSIFPMAYVSYTKNKDGNLNLFLNISIEPSEDEDMLELKYSIGNDSGDLLFHAMDFEQRSYKTDAIFLEYDKFGFKRKKYWLSIKIYGQLKAIALILISDTGINLSNLTNCIFLFVLDNKDYSRKEFVITLNKLQDYYSEANIPVLISPISYAIDYDIPYNKIYNLWVYDSAYFDKFLKFTEKFV